MTIKNIQSITVLPSSQMAKVKGGVSVKAVIKAGGTANENSAVAQAAIELGIVADDKRPPRPGGGITTL